jgi:hypothetical protein
MTGEGLVLPSIVALIWCSPEKIGAVYVLVKRPVALLVVPEVGLKVPPVPVGSVAG